MNAVIALLVVIGVVAVATAAGLLWRARNGAVKVKTVSADAPKPVRPSDVESDAAFGERATLLQFSTEFCAYCPATRRLLGGIADRTPGVEHVDIDLTHAPEIAKRFKVLQTPTTLLLDGGGAIRARIGGAPKPAELSAQLDTILKGDHHVAA